jgi:hypothetical protein
MTKRALLMPVLFAMLCLGSMSSVLADDRAILRVYQELFDQSIKEKRGLTFFVQGQTIGGVVTKIYDAGFVEVRNQTHNRIIIKLSQIDAVAAP